jgi:uncharacterized iron-regulated protein
MLTEPVTRGGAAGFLRRRPAVRGAPGLGRLAFLVVLLVATHAIASPAAREIEATPALDLSTLSDLEQVAASVADRRVVFIGEQHDRYEHHLAQLEILRRLHERDARLAIGMEAFQQPFQKYLDAYVAGDLSEQEMLRRTEYYSRWRFDYRLYAPILHYAREHGVPVVALNLPEELTRKVGREGPESLSPEERGQLPAEIDRSDADYASRLSEVFESHPRNDGQSFEQFLEVQLLWDEGMAERAAEYLTAHPETRMVILAGVGHLAYGSGIPQRLARRLPLSSAIVLNGWQGVVEPRLADFLLLPEPQSLPPAGKLGAVLEEQGNGLRIAACQPDSPCEEAGIRKGDLVISVDERAVKDIADLRLAMWDKQPGQRVTLGISRSRWFLGPRTLNFELELQEMP